MLVHSLHNKLLTFLRKDETNFKGWTDEQALKAIDEAIASRSICWHHKQSGEIDGVVVARRTVFEGSPAIHIVTIKASERGIIRDFVEHFIRHYSSYRLTGYRKGKVKDFTGICKKLRTIDLKQRSLGV